jgi:hypothetical protein
MHHMNKDATLDPLNVTPFVRHRNQIVARCHLIQRLGLIIKDLKELMSLRQLQHFPNPQHQF